MVERHGSGDRVAGDQLLRPQVGEETPSISNRIGHGSPTGGCADPSASQKTGCGALPQKR
jgi:hypothetical protein